jgi:hypothetical protein
VVRNIRMAASTGLVTAHGILWNSVHPARKEFGLRALCLCLDGGVKFLEAQ